MAQSVPLANLASITFQSYLCSSAYTTSLKAEQAEGANLANGSTASSLSAQQEAAIQQRSGRREMMRNIEANLAEFPANQTIEVEEQETLQIQSQPAMWTRHSITKWIPNPREPCPIPSPIISDYTEPSPDRTNDPDSVDDGGFYTPELGNKGSCNPERRNVHADIIKLIKHGIAKALSTKCQEERRYKKLQASKESQARELRGALRRMSKQLMEATREKQQVEAANRVLEQEKNAAEAAYEQLDGMPWKEFQQRQIAARRAGRKPEAKKAAAKKPATASKKAAPKTAPAKKAGVAAAAKPKSAGVVKGSRAPKKAATNKNK